MKKQKFIEEHSNILATNREEETKRKSQTLAVIPELAVDGLPPSSDSG